MKKSELVSLFYLQATDCKFLDLQDSNESDTAKVVFSIMSQYPLDEGGFESETSIALVEFEPFVRNFVRTRYWANGKDFDGNYPSFFIQNNDKQMQVRPANCEQYFGMCEIADKKEILDSWLFRHHEELVSEFKKFLDVFFNQLLSMGHFEPIMKVGDCSKIQFEFA